MQVVEEKDYPESLENEISATSRLHAEETNCLCRMQCIYHDCLPNWNAIWSHFHYTVS